MKLLDQVISLSQAKLLKSLGVSQDGYYCHAHLVKGLHQSFDGEATEWNAEYSEGVELIETGLAVFDGLPHYSAFTVAELSVMLPDYYPSWRFKVSESSEERKWIATIICSPKPPGADDIHTESSFDRYGKTQAEALATLLIALLETEAINVEEVNARLCA